MPAHIDCNEVYDSLPCIHNNVLKINISIKVKKKSLYVHWGHEPPT